MPVWPDRFCYAEADLNEHGVIDQLSKLVAVVKTLPCNFNRYVIESIFTGGVSEPYDALKKTVLEHGDLTDRQRSCQLFNNIDLHYGLATEMFLRILEVIG